MEPTEQPWTFTSSTLKTGTLKCSNAPETRSPKPYSSMVPEGELEEEEEGEVDEGTEGEEEGIEAVKEEEGEIGSGTAVVPQSSAEVYLTAQGKSN